MVIKAIIIESYSVITNVCVFPNEPINLYWTSEVELADYMQTLHPLSNYRGRGGARGRRPELS